MKTKVCLGSAEPPIHPQHLQIMEDFENWQLIDLYVKHPDIINMDATDLQYEDNFLEHIYASHLLEHLPHRNTEKILTHWYNKLKQGGRLTLNVPDMEWTAREIIKFSNYEPLTSNVYTIFEGNNGLQSILYGTQSHDGEYHKAAFTERSIKELLEKTKFKNVVVDRFYDGHDMGIIFVNAIK